MPQVARSGKYIFGWSAIGGDLAVTLPPQAVAEYDMAREGRVYLLTGSAQTGGFVVTRRGLLLRSHMGNVLWDRPTLNEYAGAPGIFETVRGRGWCWLPIGDEGRLTLRLDILRVLGLAPGQRLLAIRASDIAFCMGAKGPLIDRAAAFPGKIPLY